jgi:cell wall-associated NlpC family hydrolase
MLAMVYQRVMAPRAALSTLLAAAALALVPASASADPGAGADQSALGALGRTMLAAALAGSEAKTAVRGIHDSLTLLGARYRLEAKVKEATREERRPAPPPAPKKVKIDPEHLPPASAGTNGTSVPHKSSLSRAEIFAHSRAGDPGSTAILLTGVALAPPDAPEAVKGAINAANMIVGRPYVWGGGHGSFYSHGYDCSGAVSFALFGGGLIPRPLTSGELEHWGAPGPGKWVTVYANGGHAFAEIAGLRWDTVGDENGTGPRWHLPRTDTSAFVVRHPPGL